MSGSNPYAKPSGGFAKGSGFASVPAGPTFSTGSNLPVWDHFAFADVFADPVLDAQERKEEVPSPPFTRLAGSMKLIQTMLSRLLKEPMLRERTAAVNDGHVGTIYAAVQSAVSQRKGRWFRSQCCCLGMPRR